MIYLSIIVPIRNEEKFIEDTLKFLIKQDYPKNRYEIIVVDGQSTDSTRDIVNRFIDNHQDINIRLLDNPGILSSRARNIGIRESKGDLIGVIDGHVYIPDNKLFINMERLKRENNALCLARPAPLDVPGLEKGKAYWIAVARKSWLGHSSNSFIYSDHEGICDPVSSGFAYEKSVFDTVGYFDESFDAAEDVEFHYRLKKAGIMAFTSPDLLIYYYPRETFTALFKQQVRYGEGRAKFIRKHTEGFTKETLIPPGIFLAHILFPLIFLLFKKIKIVYYFGISLYWAILIGSGLNEARKYNSLFSGFIIANAIWVTHMGLGWGFIKKTLGNIFRNRFIS